MKFLLSVLLFSTLGCSYKLGFSDLRLPEDYKQVYIPVFKNNTHESGVEVFFTNALIGQFAQSKVAQVVSKNKAPVVLEGEIVNIRFLSEAQARGDDPNNDNDNETPVPNLPKFAVLNTKYRIYVSARMRLRRTSDNKVLWSAPFAGERDYAAPLLESPGVNSANALYNFSARQQKISEIAQLMMVEVHDLVAESF